MDQDELLTIYQTIFETWRSQVDSYRQRSAYFAAFETAAIAGCWDVLRQNKTLWVGILLAILGSFLTFAWIYNNHKVHKYVVHWWDSLRKLEKQLHMDAEGTDFVTQQQGGGFPPYSMLVQVVPVLFLIGWLSLFVWGVALWCGCASRPS